MQVIEYIGTWRAEKLSRGLWGHPDLGEQEIPTPPKDGKNKRAGASRWQTETIPNTWWETEPVWKVLPLQKYPQFVVFVHFSGVNTSNMLDFKVPRINKLLENLRSISQSSLASRYFSSPFYQSCPPWSQGEKGAWGTYKTLVKPGHSIHRDHNVVFQGGPLTLYSLWMLPLELGTFLLCICTT